MHPKRVSRVSQWQTQFLTLQMSTAIRKTSAASSQSEAPESGLRILSRLLCGTRTPTQSQIPCTVNQLPDPNRAELSVRLPTSPGIFFLPPDGQIHDSGDQGLGDKRACGFTRSFTNDT